MKKPQSMQRRDEAEGKTNGNRKNGKNHSVSSNGNDEQKQGKKKVHQSKQYEEQSIFFAYPMVQIIMCPLTIIFLWIAVTQPLDTSIFSYHKIYSCISHWGSGGSQELGTAFFSFVSDVWKFAPVPTLDAILIVLVFVIFETLLLRFVPGTKMIGPVAPSGDRPQYVLNGVASFVITQLVFFLCSSPSLPFPRLFSPGIVYDHFGAIVIVLTLYVKLICLLLYFKGRYYPSGRDNKVTKDAIYDFFWGVELYPQFLGLPLKQLVNCRLGMMGWSVIIVSFAWKQWEIYGYVSNSILVSVAIQLLYIFKFYLWEGGYFHSIDIMHDRFGYYICWGCMCWITGFYTSPVLWFVNNPIDLPPIVAGAIFVAGFVTLWLNWDADHQRQKVRAANGKCKVWGKTPLIIEAQYTTEDGQRRTNVLLASGWWGIARHFHYVTEILTSFFWALPALHHHLFPYAYVIYLCILLLDRLVRDEERCQKKYGIYWTKYCNLVPYRVIPYVY